MFTFGDAGFYGSTVDRRLAPAVSLMPGNGGCVTTLADGSVWSFSPGHAGEIARLPVPSVDAQALEGQLVTQRVIVTAEDQLGKPYVYGASGPSAFDCSGLTHYAYAAAGIDLPRTSAEQFTALPHVPLSEVQPGDLLLFFYPGIAHVGIYLGNGMMIDAPHPGTDGRIDAIQGYGPVMGVGRPQLG